MDPRLAAFLSSLAMLAVTGGIKLYSDVGELRTAVSQIQKDMDKQDDRERKWLDLTSRLDERLVCSQEK